MDFTGKTVLITGASYGLGEGFAHGFAAAGASLVLTARSTELLESVAAACRELGSPLVTVVAGDVSDEADVRRVVAESVAAHGKIDCLINNAGISDLRGLAPEQFDTETWNRILSVDLNGVFFYLREVGRHMLETGGGSIVNIASIMGSGSNEVNVIAYSAAKGAVRTITQQLGCEWADRGVRVNSVSPGFIITDMVRPALEGLGMDKWIASRTPMRRVGELEEVVGPVMFLCSDHASYITGHDLLVDGGTNASNGTYQIPPIHHEWNAGTTPRVGAGYPGIVPRPDWYQALAPGIPGLHYPLPEG
jgi:NAD(P)-dependent dehydrogenase (short-subunit alcohol dehydrogenase family)